MPNDISRRKKLPEKDVFLQAVELIGNNSEALGKHFGITLTSISKLRHLYNVPPPKGFYSGEPKFSEQEIKDALSSSASDHEAGLRLGVAWSTIAFYRNRYKISPAKKKWVKQSEIQYVTLSEYAKLCGIDKTSIRDRFKSGTLQLAKLPGVSPSVRLIDLKKYPPGRKK